LRTSYGKLWQEYREKSSKEAVLIHQLDKLEMALQASDYVEKGYSSELLKQFFDSAASHLKDKALLVLLHSLKHGKS
jgi:putative hydrolase of HD superfamily